VASVHVLTLGQNQTAALDEGQQDREGDEFDPNAAPDESLPAPNLCPVSQPKFWP
jgi:hypothetical protein